MTTKFEVGDYITATPFAGSVGLVESYVTPNHMRVRWFTPWCNHSQHYIASPNCWVDRACRVLSEAEVMLFLLTANYKEAKLGT